MIAPRGKRCSVDLPRAGLNARSATHLYSEKGRSGMSQEACWNAFFFFVEAASTPRNRGLCSAGYKIAEKKPVTAVAACAHGRARRSKATHAERKKRSETHVFPSQVRPTELARDVGDDVHPREEQAVFRAARGDVHAPLEKERPPTVAVEALTGM